MLNDMPIAANELFGREIGERFFAKPTNASSAQLADLDAQNTSADQSRDCYHRKGILPSDESLLDAETREAIAKMYAVDYNLICRSFE